MYQYRADRDQVILPPIMVGERRFPDRVPKRITADDVVLKITRPGKPIYSSDAQRDPVLAGEFDLPRQGKQRFVERERIVSSAAVPMKVGREIVGVMFVGYRRKHNLETRTELREKIEYFARQGATAVSNARLFSDVQRRNSELEVLNEIGRTISSAGKEEILRKVYEQTSKLMDTSNFFIISMTSQVKNWM